MVWYQYQVPNPQFLPSTDNGWNKDGDYPLFITTLIPLAPTFITFITYLVICGCKQNKCCSKCVWGSQQLNCSEIHVSLWRTQGCLWKRQSWSNPRIDDEEEEDLSLKVIHPRIQPKQLPRIIIQFLRETIGSLTIRLLQELAVFLWEIWVI